MGICLGMQIAIIEFSRNVLGLKNANSTEFNEKTKYPVIGLVTEWKDATGKTELRNKNSDLGGTMRLGGQECSIADGSLSKKLYKKSTIVERHRHRYEVNPKFKDVLVNGGMDIVGTSLDGKLAEMIEIQTEANKEMTIRNNQLQQEILDLKNGTEAIEEKARTEMGMIKEGEEFYLIAK